MKISVLMSVYKNDNEFEFRECLESLKKQTHKADEIIIVKDGNISQELQRVLDEYSILLPLVIVGYEQNHGLAYALNYGMEYCKGDLIARMDADDICYPERFEKQYSFFTNNIGLQVLGTGIEEFYIDNNGLCIKNIRLYPELTSKDSKSLYKGTPLAHPTLMIRSEILKSFKYNLNNKKYSQDIELWFRLIQSGIEIHTIQEPLLHFRVTDKTFSRRNISKAKTELHIYMKGLIKLHGFSFRLVYPLIRFCSRLLPVSLIKKLYFSKSRKRLFKKN